MRRQAEAFDLGAHRPPVPPRQTVHRGPRIPVVAVSPHLNQRVDGGRATKGATPHVRIAESTRVRGGKDVRIEKFGSRQSFAETTRVVRRGGFGRLEEMNLVARIEETRRCDASPGAGANDRDATNQDRESDPSLLAAVSAWRRAASA